MNQPPIEIWTDGACRDNPGGPGGWAFVVQVDGERLVARGGEESTTNNRMELFAILAALRFCEDDDEVVIHSDSEYAIKVSSGTFNAKANLDLVDPIREQIERLRRVRFQHVYAHTGVPLNERADYHAGVMAKGVQPLNTDE